MWDIERLGRALCGFAVIAVAATACGSEGGTGSGATDPNVAVDASADDAPVDDASGSASADLTIDRLCDPLDDVATAWVGGDVERAHADLFAADDPASLICEWQGTPVYREVRVVYHASPAVWEATVAGGGTPLDEVAADNVYDDQILSVHADNGWTVDVVAFEGDPPDYADVPDLLAEIANAAVAAAR